MLEGRFYRRLETATSYFLLNVLWLLACLPIITLFPATAAMFAVIRGWSRDADDGPLRAFRAHFRENFGQALGVGILWCAAGGVLLLDFFLVGQMSPGLRAVLGSLLVLLTFLYAGASVYLFPVMVHYDAGWRAVLKNSLLFAIARLPTTFACLLVLALAIGLAIIAPFSVLFTGSPTAYAVYRLCAKAFPNPE